MYVCVCNALTDKQVSEALADGARTASAVYRRLGCKAQCGKCVRVIGARLKTGSREDGAACAMTAAMAGAP